MDEGKFRSSTFLSYLIRGMVEGVIFIDDENVIRLCNPVGGTIRGVKGDDIVGSPFLECHPKSTYKKVLDIIELLKSGKKKELKRTVRFKGGFYEHTYSAVRDKNGVYLGVVAVSRDITERVILEKDLKEHSKKLEDSNQLKDLFADIMSHDFINPASIVQNLAGFLLDESLPEEKRQDVIIIKRNADRLIEMVQNARTITRLEDAKNITFHELDLGKIILGSMTEFQPFLNEKDMKFRHSFDKKYLAEVSPVISEVFSNLISNAVKYSPEKSTIDIEIEDRGESFLIAVADQAQKIPKESRKSIFKRFTRIGKETVKGSGLGLAIVKRVVELHKGKVWVEDNPNGGNIFKVEIPKKKGK
jgi:two-component system phosphate regulon sensor histidine kinase PhoR